MQWLPQDAAGFRERGHVSGIGKNWGQWAVCSLPLLHVAAQLALIRGDLDCEPGQLLS